MHALSDLELENVQESGAFGTISYDLECGETIHVATTRLETLSRDKGIAVNPQDEWYAGYRGQRTHVPFLGRWVPIVADEAADLEKERGLVTPAHDFLDFHIAHRINLSMSRFFMKQES